MKTIKGPKHLQKKKKTQPKAIHKRKQKLSSSMKGKTIFESLF